MKKIIGELKNKTDILYEKIQAAAVFYLILFLVIYLF